MKSEKEVPDLKFEFTDVLFECAINSDNTTEEQCSEIKSIVESVSKNIYIDRSYVQCKENKRSDTFLYENGWKEMCKMLSESRFGKDLGKPGKDSLVEVYSYMTCLYVLGILKNFGYDQDHVQLRVRPGTKFHVKISEDKSTFWKNYPGKWQSWKKDYFTKCK